MLPRTHRKSAFSLVELVVVIVIIGILAAIAIPRLSRGASGASQSALRANLTTIRNAISVYHAEHNSKYPDSIVDQLTMYTDINGTTSATKTATAIYGPYLLTFPACPVGPNATGAKADEVLVSGTTPVTVNETSGEGWVYNTTTGEFRANTDDKDEQEKPYNEY